MAIADSQSRSQGIYGRVQGLADRIVSPSTRQQYYDTAYNFGQDQPLLASFLLSQFLLSFVPIFLFASFALGTILFSFVTALLFSLFWIGAALVLLIPTLFITVSLAIGVWMWAVGSFLVAKWLYGFLPGSASGEVVVNGKTVANVKVDQ